MDRASIARSGGRLAAEAAGPSVGCYHAAGAQMDKQNGLSSKVLVLSFPMLTGTTRTIKYYI